MHHKSVIKLTPQQVIAFTMKRQHLTQPAKQPLDVVRSLIAIQAQYGVSVPIAVWSRCIDLSPNWVDYALFETRDLVKTWCLRGTVHVLASADLAMMVQSIGQQQKYEFEHFMKTRRGIGAQEIQRLNKLILRALVERPLSRSELHTTVPELASIQGASWGLDVKGLAFTGDIVFANSVGAKSCFARRDVWLPKLQWELPSEDGARRDLVLRYLATHGPSTMQDFAHWSGLKMKVVKSVFKACASELALAEVTGWGKNYYLRSQDEPVLKSDSGELPEVRLLPKFDPLLMGYRHKTRFVDEENLAQVYRPGGQVEAVVLLQGRTVATWRTNSQGARLRLAITTFRRLNQREQSLVKSATERLATFLGAEELNLVLSGQ
jgi:hypothetical protein